MADFLTQLIARSLDQAPRLQRRQPAFFEPHAQDQQSLSEITVEQSAVLPAPAQPAPPSRAVRVAESLSRSEPTQPVPPPAPAAPQPTAHLRPTVPPAERLVEHHTERLHEVPPAPQSVVHHFTETRQEHTHAEVRQTVIEQHRIIERPIPVAAALQPRLDRTIVEQRPIALAKAPSPRGQENPQARPPAAAKPSLPLPQRTPKIAAPPPPLPAPEPESVITVSIGRVEIRAAQPATAPPRASRPAAPKLGLDEYLRRRTGGVQ